MNRLSKALLVFMVCSFGLWGCAQGPAGSAGAEKLRVLEGKYSKLEEDYRALSSAREQLRKKLGESEEQRVKLTEEVKDREDLQKLVTSRTGERDALQNQMEQLRKGIRGLLTQVEASATSPSLPTTTSAVQNSTTTAF